MNQIWFVRLEIAFWGKRDKISANDQQKKLIRSVFSIDLTYLKLIFFY